jgi:expansin (peptidoglycan-binding protein)
MAPVERARVAWRWRTAQRLPKRGATSATCDGAVRRARRTLVFASSLFASSLHLAIPQAVVLGAASLLALAPLGCGSDRSSDTGGGGHGASGASGTGTASGGCVPGACTTDPSCSADAGSHQGQATYYTFADGSGNCSFPATPNDLMVGAMNHVDYGDSAACGACAQVKGPNGSITIRIVDQCPECPQGNIDLSPDAFGKIADLAAGVVPITWSYVPCDVMGPIQYHFKDGSNQWWTAIQIRNHRYRIAKLEYKDASGSYVAVGRESYNFFVKADGMGPGPYALRVTDVNGQVLEDMGIPSLDNADAPGAGQFPICGTQ